MTIVNYRWLKKNILFVFEFEFWCLEAVDNVYINKAIVFVSKYYSFVKTIVFII